MLVLSLPRSFGTEQSVQLDSDQLELIAGEDAETKNQ